MLTHWGRVTHICVSKLTIIGSDNGLSPDRRQAIIWTNAGLLLIGPLGTNFREILIEILTFSFKKMHSKMSSGNWRPFCLGLNVLSQHRSKGFSYQWCRCIVNICHNANFTCLHPRHIATSWHGKAFLQLVLLKSNQSVTGFEKS